MAEIIIKNHFKTEDKEARAADFNRLVSMAVTAGEKSTIFIRK